MTTPVKKEPFKMERGVKYRDAAKTSIIQVRNIDPDQELLKKPLAQIYTNVLTTEPQPL